MKERDIFVFTVGDHTEKAALDAGFQNIMSAAGDGEDLVNLIENEAVKGGLPLLHIRGDHIARPLDKTLSEKGYVLEALIAYESRPVLSLGKNVVEAFQNDRVDAVTFFSKRTAENFMSLAAKNGFSHKLIGTKALCLGEAMVECVLPSLWQNVYVTRTPDREGMLALIDAEVGSNQNKRTRTMTTTDPNTIIPDAEKIIERFGGIRPMASKMEIPVTTVQGWKKRNAIPATRRDDIMTAARIHNVQISDLISSSIANENSFTRPVATSSFSSGFGATPEIQPTIGESYRPAPQTQTVINDNLEERLAMLTRNAVTRSVLINIALIILCVGAVVAVLWPDSKTNEERIQAVEVQLDEVKEDQSTLKGLVPANLQERLVQLQEQAIQIQQGTTSAIDRAQAVSSDVLAQDAGTLDQRITALEKHITEMGGSPKMLGVLEKIRGMQQTVGGQAQLDQVVQALSGFVAGAQDPAQVDQKLAEAQSQNPAVAETFSGVAPQDLKAAAMLVGLSQFRESLNRDNQPFNDDLALLTKLVGEDNPELKASLEKLAPQAEKGVLTPEGLSSEFKGLTGDIVVSSLKGEDVSIQEKAKARMNELLAVEKDGQLITGTDTQATVARTQSFLNQGDLESAIGQVQTLEGPAAQAVAPWLDQAKMTLLAQQAKKVIGQTINMHALGGAGGITAGGVTNSIGNMVPGMGSELIQDKESGINILKPAPGLPTP